MHPRDVLDSPGDVRLLLADDDDELRRALADELRAAGFTVDEARDGREALEWLERSPVVRAVALLDVRMPGMSGLEVLDAAANREVETPIVVMTAFGDDDFRAATITRGAAAVLDKPFEIETLVTTLNEILAYLGRERRSLSEPCSPSSTERSPARASRR